jgi:hypothetical protein
LDVFWVGALGDISSGWWDASFDNGRWQGPFSIAPPTAARADSPLVAVAREPEHLDVFWIGARGDISSASWDASLDNGRWQGPFSIAPPTAARADSPLVAVARKPEHLDVFWVGALGDISSAWWDAVD